MKIALQLIMVLITFGLMSIGLIFIPSNLIVLVVTLIGCGIGVMIKHAFFCVRNSCEKKEGSFLLACYTNFVK